MRLVILLVLVATAASAPRPGPKPKGLPPTTLKTDTTKLVGPLRQMCRESSGAAEGGSRVAPNGCGGSSGRRLFQTPVPASPTSPLLWDNNNYATLAGANMQNDLTYWLQATNFDGEVIGDTIGETTIQDDVPVGVSTCDGNQRAEWFKLNDLTFIMFAAQLPGFDGTCQSTACKVKSIRVRIQSDAHGAGGPDGVATDGPTPPTTNPAGVSGDGYYCEVILRSDGTYTAQSSAPASMSAVSGTYKYAAPVNAAGTTPATWPNPYTGAGQLDSLSGYLPAGPTTTPLQYDQNQMCGWDSGKTIRFPLQACKVLYRIHPTNWPLRVSATVQFDDMYNPSGSPDTGVCAAYLATRTRKCNTDEGRYSSVGGYDENFNKVPTVGNGQCSTDPMLGDGSVDFMDGHYVSYDKIGAGGTFNSISKCNVAGDCVGCSTPSKQFDLAFKLRANAKCTGGTSCGCAFPCSNLNKVEQQCGGEGTGSAK